MKYRLIIFSSVVALLVSIFYIYFNIKSSRLVDKQKVDTHTNSTSLDIVKIKSTKYTPDYAALARMRENPLYKFIGNGSSGKVIDARNQVLMESGKDISIFAVDVGPDKQQVLIKGGDSINYILNPTTGIKFQLPVYPPGNNMFGFSWYWLGETKLIGISGVQISNDKGKPVSSCGGNNVAKTKLYVYEITNQKLTEVDLSASIKHSVINVVEVINDGHLHLVYEDPHGKENKDLGWFKIE